MAQLSELFFSIGLRPVNCDGLTVENCEFAYTPVPNASLVAVGILAAGRCTTLRVERNRFEMPQNARTAAAGGPVNVSFGFVLVPTSITGDVALTSIKAGVSAQVLASFLHDALFRDNLITGLSLPTLVYADCGLVEVESNTVRNCLSGFWFFSLPTLAFANNLADIKVSGAVAETASVLQNAIFSAVGHPAIQLATATLRAFPVPDKADLSGAIKVTVGKQAATAKQFAGIQNLFDKTLASVVHPAPQAPAPAGAVTQIVDKTTIKLGDIATTLIEHPLAATTPVQLDVTGLNQNLAILEKQAFATPVARGVPVAIHASDNDVNNLVTGALSAFSFLLWNLGQDDKDGISLTGNSLVGANGTSPIALLLGVSRSMVIGNMVLNEAARVIGNNRSIPSLWLFPFPAPHSSTGDPVLASAITGNVFRGVPILPLRNLTPVPPAPMNTWDFFNAEV